jgi:hypothetical protein
MEVGILEECRWNDLELKNLVSFFDGKEEPDAA